jgi:uncharacterized membrane protein
VAVNRETFDIALSAHDERPEERKAEFLRREARDLLATHQISADVYSRILARLARPADDQKSRG